eukprot:Nk52_evm29s288 gene=Nk52_evmTU29s288
MARLSILSAVFFLALCGNLCVSRVQADSCDPQCTEPSGKCDPGGWFSSPKCVCNTNYKLDSTSKFCVADCTVCGDAATYTCTETNIPLNCACNAGYSNSVAGDTTSPCVQFCKVSTNAGLCGEGGECLPSDLAPYYTCLCSPPYTHVNPTDPCTNSTTVTCADNPNCGLSPPNQCAEDMTSTTNNKYKCVCATGYENTIPSDPSSPCNATAVDPCADTTICGDQGQCTVMGTSYTCTCTTGYANLDANNATSPCVKDLCNVEPKADCGTGTCSLALPSATNTLGYICTCTPPDTWENPSDHSSKCQSTADPCKNVDCGEGGKCSTSPTDIGTFSGTYVCKCNATYVHSGTDPSTPCKKEEAYCAAHAANCPDHSECSDTLQKCVCITGYKEENGLCVELCTSTTCQSYPHTTCKVDSSNAVKCECESGYVGTGNNDCTKDDGPSPSTGGGGDDNTGLIIGLVVGLGALALIVAGGLWWFFRNKKKKASLEEDRVNRAMEEAAFHIGTSKAAGSGHGYTASQSASVPASARSSGNFSRTTAPNRAALQKSTEQLLDDEDAVYDEPGINRHA